MVSDRPYALRWRWVLSTGRDGWRTLPVCPHIQVLNGLGVFPSQGEFLGRPGFDLEQLPIAWQEAAIAQYVTMDGESCPGVVPRLVHRGESRFMARVSKPSRSALVAVLVVAFSAARHAQSEPSHAKPLLRDFLGLNVHTVQFRPELYKPIARLLRDYHGFTWDVGEQTDYKPAFPHARNGVNWQELYGEWNRQGYSVDVCVQFDAMLPPAWEDLSQDAYAYGFEFAKYFGPSGPHHLAESIEIGNEPGDYSDAEYRTLLERAASGIRKADPKLLIATCAVFARPSGKYHKSVESLQGLEPLYDVLNVHSYPMLEGYPTWRRSIPEDARLTFLTDIEDVIAWRDKHAPGKQVWLTEFGYDATTKPQPRQGTFSKWVDVTDEQQAQYLVRSILVLAELPLNRAYIYWFNDNDEPQLHGASGLTRNYMPKPAYYAVAHLYDVLGDYRFGRVIARQPGKYYVYEFVDPARDTLWAVWRPTGDGRAEHVKLDIPASRIKRAERMPLKAGPAEAVAWAPAGADQVSLEVDETPLYLWIEGTSHRPIPVPVMPPGKTSQ